VPMEFRRFQLVFLVLSLLLLLRMGDEGTSRVMDLISVENLRRHVQSIHFDRNPSDRFEEMNQAAQIIYDQLLKTGLKVRKEPFQWEGRWFHNIVAEKEGSLSPDNVLIIGAHYDTVPGSPGADDNASAVAVLLEMARHLPAEVLASSVRLIAFALEEYGYVGSTYHARKAHQSREKIIGMISLEMVGFTGPNQNYPPYIDAKYYPAVGDFIAIIGDTKSQGLLKRVQRVLKTSIPGLPAELLEVPENGGEMEISRLSDHSPFWDHGYPALMVTDTAFLRNPNYHLSTDTLETLDFEFMRKVAVGMYCSIIGLAK
jgi:aminopeptidase YwaD